MEHNFNNSLPPQSKPCLGTPSRASCMTTRHFAVRSSNKPPIHHLPRSLSLSKKVFGILNLLTQSRLMNRVRSLCKSIMLQIWGVISSSSSQAPGAPSLYLQFPDWAIIYSTQMTIIHTVKSRQNLIPKASPSQIVDWKDNNTFKLELL